jgi:hypothetical protein
VTGQVSIGTILAPTGHSSVNQGRIGGQGRRRADTKTLSYSGTQALDEDVSRRNQFDHYVNALRMLQIDRNRLIPPVVQVEGRVA